MDSQNIFIQLQRWSKFIHPLSQLIDLKVKENTNLIKSYFTSKPTNTSTLHQISSTQLHKCNSTLKDSKIKQIYKQKGRKLLIRKRINEGKLQFSVKSSSKTNSLSEQDQQVSQYLNFQEQEIQLISKSP